MGEAEMGPRIVRKSQVTPGILPVGFDRSRDYLSLLIDHFFLAESVTIDVICSLGTTLAEE
jgi:hypothetical protein